MLGRKRIHEAPPFGVLEISDEEFTEPAMARMAALSGGGSFGHAVTTRARSGPSETNPCASLCALDIASGCESRAGDRFESCRSDHFLLVFLRYFWIY
jgi:hypothetical protein